eukprot:TRINITY_DN4990_c1_g1_i3.p1 TRINITY_DN4990_c1_g1~~TRINITY_DN4990_c1_g1_i3.p1  ORF type:complete len:716 (-),score=200.35 TRINITY_DN4990_c1_g1_i3:36-2183(-)
MEQAGLTAAASPPATPTPLNTSSDRLQEDALSPARRSSSGELGASKAEYRKSLEALLVRRDSKSRLIISPLASPSSSPSVPSPLSLSSSPTNSVSPRVQSLITPRSPSASGWATGSVRIKPSTEGGSPGLSSSRTSFILGKGDRSASPLTIDPAPETPEFARRTMTSPTGSSPPMATVPLLTRSVSVYTAGEFTSRPGEEGALARTIFGSPATASPLTSSTGIKSPLASSTGSEGTSPALSASLSRMSVRPEDLIGDDSDDEGENEDLLLERIEEPDSSSSDKKKVTILVKGGTLEKLVDRITWPKEPDPKLQSAFLLTYRSFTTPLELLERLIARYNIEPSPDMPGEDFMKFNKRKKIIQFRVCNILKQWLDKHFYDFQKRKEVEGKQPEFELDAESPLVLQMGKFIDGQIRVDIESQGNQLKKLLYNPRVQHQISWSSDPPPPITPKTPQFTDFDPVEVARQLTIIEQYLYRDIESNKECIGQAWNKADKDELAPHIVAMVKRFNLVSTWVATEIVRTEKLKLRYKVLCKFITIAMECRKLGNFNAVMEILAGLQNAAIYRLKHTWDKVNAKQPYAEQYQSLLDLMSNKGNFKDYRAALMSCQPPCIPYLGVFLTDLTFIEDGMKNTLNDRSDLINFDKRRKVSVVIGHIQQYQQPPYNLSKEGTIYNYLLNIEGLTQKALYKYSLICEPKGRDMPAHSSSFSLMSFLGKKGE